MRTLGVPVPGWMSQLAGKSKEVQYSIGANHNYNKDTLINYLRSIGSTAAVVTITGDLVSYSSAVACLEFPSDLQNSYITLIINSGVTVYGRGGNGGSNSAGSAGGTAIQNGIGNRLRITNRGAIAGGGGGGGRPFGAAGRYSGPGGDAAKAGTLTSPGTGSGPNANHGGTGGNVGASGGACYGNSGTRHGGGAAGAAVRGNAPRWDAVGAIYGSRV